jgi:hypothetical protein
MTALRRFISASGMTNLADGIAVVAWGWIASLLTRDALLVALVPVALRLPWALLALPAGLVTDRVDRRRLIIAMDAVRALAFLGAALALWDALPLDAAPAKGVSAPELYGALLLAAFLVGGAEVFRDNAAQIMLPALVPKDWLERANGQLWSAELLTNALIGPGTGGLDAGPVLRGDGVLGPCLERGLGQHAAADDPGCASGAGELDLPPAGLGDDALGAGVVGAGGVAGGGFPATEHGPGPAVLGGGHWLDRGHGAGLGRNPARICRDFPLIARISH